MTAPSLNVCSTYEEKSKRRMVHKTLLQSSSANKNESKSNIVNKMFSQSCSVNKDESKQSIVDENLLQNYSADVNKLCSTEEYKSECTIMEQKCADNEVTYNVPYDFNVFNIFEKGRNNPEVSYERAYMANERDEYFTEMIDHLNEYNNHKGQILSSKIFKEAVLRVMEEEEQEIKRNNNIITCDTSFKYPNAMNVQKKDAKMSLERRLDSGILEEMVEIFKGYTIPSTISNSEKQVDKIKDSEERVDARNWIRNNSAEQVGQINDSDKQVDAISDSKKIGCDWKQSKK